MMDKERLMDTVLTAGRTELGMLYPAWNLAFAWLPLQYSAEYTFATDGSQLYVSDWILPVYAASPAAFRRGYLHMLLHCLFLHIAPPLRAEREKWNLACDILVERYISQMNQPRLHTEVPGRDEILARLPERVLTVSELMDCIDSLPLPRTRLNELFSFDDHQLWWKGISQEALNRWKSLQDGAGQNGSRRGHTAAGVWQDFALLTYSPRDYRPLLREFMIPGEEIEPDDESFDYICYDLGVRHYGNVPLLEPLEYKEVYRLDTLVIAIDTSSSCDEATVRRFLSETYSIIASQENFFSRMHVLILQCDCCLQDSTVIHSREEWLRCADNIKIRGRGGTDYQPVFRRVEELRKQGSLKKPRALLYFTDGDGAYPSEPPDYQTVFILAGKTIHPELVPRWGVIKEVL